MSKIEIKSEYLYQIDFGRYETLIYSKGEDIKIEQGVLILEKPIDRKWVYIDHKRLVSVDPVIDGNRSYPIYLKKLILSEFKIVQFRLISECTFLENTEESILADLKIAEEKYHNLSRWTRAKLWLKRQ